MIVLDWKDKKGYSLVELIISIAILSIVAITISALMRAGTYSFSNAQSELDLQMESQTLLAQLNSMIMESNQVVYDDAHKLLVLYQIEQERVAVPAPSDGSSAPKYQTNKTLKDIKLIKFDAASNSLYLEEHDTDVVLPASGGAALSYPEDELFSKYIDSFDVTIDGSNVTVELGMKNQKKRYDASATTKLRNGLVTYP